MCSWWGDYRLGSYRRQMGDGPTLSERPHQPTPVWVPGEVLVPSVTETVVSFLLLVWEDYPSGMTRMRSLSTWSVGKTRGDGDVLGTGVTDEVTPGRHEGPLAGRPASVPSDAPALTPRTLVPLTPKSEFDEPSRGWSHLLRPPPLYPKFQLPVSD